MSDISELEHLQIQLRAANQGWITASEYLEHANDYLAESRAHPNWGDMHVREARRRIHEYTLQERTFAEEVMLLLRRINTLKAAMAQPQRPPDDV